MSNMPKPLKLYTVDVQPENVEQEDEMMYFADLYMSSKERKIKRIQGRMKRNNIRDSAFNGNFEVSNLLYSNTEIIAMTEPFTK